MPDYHVLPKSELPAGVMLEVKCTTLAVNPLVLVPWLKKQLDAKPVKFVRAKVSSIEEARKLTKAKVIVNAFGVGAQKLAGDEAVRPVRGQTIFARTDFAELVMREGSEYTYVIPRMISGGVIMDGIKLDRLDAEVDVELKSANGAFEGLDLNAVDNIVGFRSERKEGSRVEREGDVVHAYGVEGAGYIHSLGLQKESGS